MSTRFYLGNTPTEVIKEAAQELERYLDGDRFDIARLVKIIQFLENNITDQNAIEKTIKNLNELESDLEERKKDKLAILKAIQDKVK